MTRPLLLLAIPTVIIGWPLTILPFFPFVGHGTTTPVLERMLEYGRPTVAAIMEELPHETHYWAFAASLIIAAAGIGGAAAYYAPAWTHFFRPTYPIPVRLRRRFDARRPASRFSGIHNFLIHKWYFDELYDFVFVKPTLALARFSSEFDRRLIDGIVNGTARLTELLSRLEGVFDVIAVDGLVNLTAKAVYATGDWGRSIQTGRLRNYLMFLAVALVGLSVGVFAWIR